MNDLQRQILDLKKSTDTLLLAHNYQLPEIQDVADFVGDSLGLAYKAKESRASRILFCGVHFMAETAKIVNPSRPVLLPDLDAGCSLADSCDAGDLQAFLQAQADRRLFVVAYINCSAGVKALSDLICTSGNAEKLVRMIPPDREILFVPDQNLGEWVATRTGRQMTLWEGSCYVHVEFTHSSIVAIREKYPEAPVVAHPECTRPVRMLADEICSTEKMISYCREHPSKTFIIVTESGMLHRLRKELPDRTFIAGPTDQCQCADCRFMKLNTLDKVLRALTEGSPQIQMDEQVRQKALAPIERMLEWSQR